jgi:hypothetical protein
VAACFLDGEELPGGARPYFLNGGRNSMPRGAADVPPHGGCRRDRPLDDGSRVRQASRRRIPGRAQLLYSGHGCSIEKNTSEDDMWDPQSFSRRTKMSSQF